MGGFKLTADLLALAVPCAFAATAFSTLIVRSFVQDPEISAGIPEETLEAAKKGTTYRMQFQQYFKGGRMSLFDNEPRSTA